jgi:hypothetical protein
MELLVTFVNKDKMAKVTEVSLGQFSVEYFLDGKLMNKTTHPTSLIAEEFAERYTNIDGSNPTFLRD